MCADGHSDDAIRSRTLDEAPKVIEDLLECQTRILTADLPGHGVDVVIHLLWGITQPITSMSSSLSAMGSRSLKSRCSKRPASVKPSL